jgi:hypothetical protein
VFIDGCRCEFDEDEATIESRGFGLPIPKFVTETRDYAGGWGRCRSFLQGIQQVLPLCICVYDEVVEWSMDVELRTRMGGRRR